MTMWIGYRFVASLLAGAFALMSVGLLCAADKRPNILFLFADDQRPDTIAALGNDAIRTPTLDALVERGFVFHNAYCLGSNVGAVCSPSRNMLMTGRAYFRWNGRLASPELPNLPATMKQAGYFTYHHGKRGNTATAIQALFDVNKYVEDKPDRLSGEPGKVIVDEAIEFFAQRTSEQPVFMYLAFSNPHDPRVAHERFRRQYEPAEIPLPKNYLPVHPFDNGEMTVRDEKLAPWPRTEQEIRSQLHDYYATITGLDFHMGRLLRALKEQGRLDNTIVMFSADHGLAIGSHGLMGKQSLYEHSMQAPLLFAGPGIPHGQSDALVYLLDLFPTIADLGGGPIPNGLDGHSLKPILQGKTSSVRDSLFLAYRDVQRAIRVGDWKLIRYPHINRTQLFNLAADPDEMHDLSAAAEHQSRVEQLMAKLAEAQRQYGDSAPLTSQKPRSGEFEFPHSR
ncbi:MAG: sulfatase-like hydrolase/transferase [Planctomycetales bacterium]|nr:sulfatase-like hydrolase/transferase [Planctomycetales bacterium]